MVMEAGPRIPSWAVSYRLAVVLSLAAAPPARSFAAARGARPAHRHRWSTPLTPTLRSPVPACTARPRVPPVRALLTAASVPAMVRNWD